MPAGRQITWALVKTAVFTLVVPGMVAGYVPWTIARREALRPRLELPFALGLLPILVGAAIYLWCAWEFATRGLGTPAPIDPPKTLMARGLYRHVRNPMYVGVLSAILGEALLFGARVLLGYAVCVFAAFAAMVLLYEEPALRSAFGEAYAEYCRRVPRWIPRRSPVEKTR